MPDPPPHADEETVDVLPFRETIGESAIEPEDSTSPPRQRTAPGAWESNSELLELEGLEASDEGASPDVSSQGRRDDQTDSVTGKRVALVGRFGSMNRREAANVLQSYSATVVDLPRGRPRDGMAPADASSNPGPSNAPQSVSLGVDWIVIGAEQPPLSQTEVLPSMVIEAAGRGELEILQETELWQRLGLVDVEQSVRRFYTPVMLADLLGVSVRIIRRWHRRGLIKPVITLHKLPYFDYAEVATAKRLAGWIDAGASARAIEQRLVDLVEVLPNIRRPLDQLSILVEGKHVLLRQGDGLIEPGGQMRFDFAAADSMATAEGSSPDRIDDDSDRSSRREIVAFPPPGEPPMLRTVGHLDEDPILEAAYQAEDDDDLETAVELYHTILARDGASPEVNFQIGELLYRMNHLVAARERYYSAIELDPEFVEARASLGGVLAELGQLDLAVAALRGTLTLFDDYADVHYTLAKTLDKMGHDVEALPHWKRIVELAPESSWAAEANERLGMPS